MRHIFWNHTETKEQGEIWGSKSKGGDRSKKGDETRRQRVQGVLAPIFSTICTGDVLGHALSQAQCFQTEHTALARSLPLS